MRAPLIQRQIKANAELLTEVYADIAVFRAERKKFNAQGDNQFVMPMISEIYYAQAALFTPEINKLAKKLRGLEEIQIALKHELRCTQCLEDWAEEDDDSWLADSDIYLLHGVAHEDGRVVWEGVPKLLSEVVE